MSEQENRRLARALQQQTLHKSKRSLRLKQKLAHPSFRQPRMKGRPSPAAQRTLRSGEKQQRLRRLRHEWLKERHELSRLTIRVCETVNYDELIAVPLKLDEVMEEFFFHSNPEEIVANHGIHGDIICLDLDYELAPIERPWRPNAKPPYRSFLVFQVVDGNRIGRAWLGSMPVDEHGRRLTPSDYQQKSRHRSILSGSGESTPQRRSRGKGKWGSSIIRQRGKRKVRTTLFC